ncbi:MAG TPA: thiamine phosphate synthase, partial [Novosphingobium sp.]|nr:thiamine phosphate synthase [Novosphingobium sp.]
AARARGLAVVVAGDAALARRWRADGAYGAAARLAGGGALLRLITAHSLAEIAAAHRARASAILLSPAFATRSHPGAPALGPVRWRLLAARCLVPVIALGGLTRHSARRLGARACHGWAAIDGLS